MNGRIGLKIGFVRSVLSNRTPDIISGDLRSRFLNRLRNLFITSLLLMVNVVKA